MTKANARLEQLNNAANKRSHAFFYCGMAMMIALIFARNILEVSIPVIAVLVIGALVALISTREEMIALVIACVPMSAAFQYKYLVFICIIIYLVKFGNDVKITPIFLPLCLMIVWDLFHGLLYPFNFVECLRGFAEIIFCAFLMFVAPKKIDYKLISRLLAISSICMMMIVLLNLLEQTHYNFKDIFVGTYRFGVGDADVEDYGVNYNSNSLGLIANLSIAGLLQLIIAKKNNVFDYLMIVILFLFGVMTMSRSFLICFVLLLTMFAVSGVPTLKGKMERIALIALIAALLVFLVMTLMPTVYETFAARFEVDDISNGRNDLFAFYSNHLFSSPMNILFGVGRQEYGDIAKNMYPEVALDTGTYICHNGTQEILVCWGLPGFVMFAWFIVEMINRKPKGLKRSLVNYIPLVIILVAAQAGQLITDGNKLLAFAFAYISLCYNFSGGENEQSS